MLYSDQRYVARYLSLLLLLSKYYMVYSDHYESIEKITGPAIVVEHSQVTVRSA